MCKSINRMKWFALLTFPPPSLESARLPASLRSCRGTDITPGLDLSPKSDFTSGGGASLRVENPPLPFPRKPLPCCPSVARATGYRGNAAEENTYGGRRMWRQRRAGPKKCHQPGFSVSKSVNDRWWPWITSRVSSDCFPLNRTGLIAGDSLQQCAGIPEVT